MSQTNAALRKWAAIVGYGIMGHSVKDRAQHENWLREFDYWNRSQVEAYQLKELRSLLQDVKTTVPYYRDLLSEGGFDLAGVDSLKAIERIQPLTKDLIRCNSVALCTSDLHDAELRATSGSSGTPLSFYWDRNYEYKHYASINRYLSYANFDRTLPKAYFWGNVEDFKRSKRLKGLVKNWLDNTLYLDSYRLSPITLSTFYARIARIDAYWMFGFPSSIFLFAKYLRENKLKLRSPRAIFTTAETLYDHQRSTMRSVFGCDVFSQYGCQELGVIGSECRCHCGFHVNESHFIVEILRNAMASRENSVGRVVVTALLNRKMPLLRYVLDDVAEIDTRPCECGRQSARLVGLKGRVTDMIVDKNGGLINFGLFSDVLEYVRKIHRYKVYQKEKGFVQIQLEVEDGFAQHDLSSLVERLSVVLGSRLEIDAQVVERIADSMSGKYQPVRSEVSAQFV